LGAAVEEEKWRHISENESKNGKAKGATTVEDEGA